MLSRVWKWVLVVVAVPVLIAGVVAVGIVTERGCSAERLAGEGFDLPEREEMEWSVCPGLALTGPRDGTVTSFSIAGALDDRTIAATAAMIDRLASRTPADPVHTILHWNTAPEDGDPHLDAFVVLYLDGMTDVPFDQREQAVRTSSAPGVAEELDTGLETTGQPYELRVRVDEVWPDILVTRSF